MPGKYAVPQEIRAMRPAGTVVKRQGNHYYVYLVKSTSVKVQDEDGKWRWKSVTKSGPCIGKIVPGEGYVPNGERTYDGEVTTFRYGAYELVTTRSEKVLDALKGTFDARDAARIYCLACQFVVLRMQRTRDVSRRHKASVLALLYPNVKLGKSALSRLYEDLGERAGLQTRFQQALVDASSGRVAVDGHVIACSSERNPLSAWGYKHKKLGTPQLNWISAYDVRKGRPLCNEMLCGNVPDCSAFEALLGRFSFKGTLFLVDRGFNTDGDKALMTQNGNSYICPMVSDRKDYQGVYDRFKVDHRRFFVYDKEGGASVIYYRVFDEDGVRRVCYVDSTMAGAEKATYARKLAEGKPGYTAEGLAEAEKDFGLFILECSDATMSPREIFEAYKERWKIETFYDYVKHELEFETLYQQDHCRTQGLAFVVQIAGMVHAEASASLAGTGVTFSEAVEILSDVMLAREGSGLRLKNVTKEVRALCQKIGLSLSHGVERVAEIERQAGLAG